MLLGLGTTMGRGTESAFGRLRDLECELVRVSSVPPSRLGSDQQLKGGLESPAEAQSTEGLERCSHCQQFVRASVVRHSTKSHVQPRAQAYTQVPGLPTVMSHRVVASVLICILSPDQA